MASGRFSLRRRPKTERHLRAAPLLAAFALVVADSAFPQQETDAPTGSALLDRFLDEVTTLTADFVQTLETGDDVETQTGRLALERPSRFRWQYEEPYEQLIVADGKNLWTLDVELEQATVMPLDDKVASTPAMLLGGDRAVREGFTVVDEFQEDGLSWVKLEPQIEGTDFESVLLGFDGLAPRRLEFANSLGHVTTITLTDVELNVDLDDDLFRFDRPRGVDLIGTPAR
ncbi:MAG TPA: outer membrane lipoprotein chaperone LolA [Gammaproteobacteria bacterium]